MSCAASRNSPCPRGCSRPSGRRSSRRRPGSPAAAPGSADRSGQRRPRRTGMRSAPNPAGPPPAAARGRPLRHRLRACSPPGAPVQLGEDPLDRIQRASRTEVADQDQVGAVRTDHRLRAAPAAGPAWSPRSAPRPAASGRTGDRVASRRANASPASVPACERDTRVRSANRSAVAGHLSGRIARVGEHLGDQFEQRVQTGRQSDELDTISRSGSTLTLISAPSCRRATARPSRSCRRVPVSIVPDSSMDRAR